VPTWDQTADFEEGDLTDFNATSAAGGGAIAASTDAEKNGTYGLAVTLTLGTAGDTAYGDLTGPVAETQMTVEFWLDPSSLTMDNGNTFVSVRLLTDAGTPATAVQVNLGFLAASGYRWGVDWFDDAAGATS